MSIETIFIFFSSSFTLKTRTWPHFLSAFNKFYLKKCMYTIAYTRLKLVWISTIENKENCTNQFQTKTTLATHSRKYSCVYVSIVLNTFSKLIGQI